MTLAEALTVLRRLPHTLPLDVREIAAIRTVCDALAERAAALDDAGSELGE